MSYDMETSALVTTDNARIDEGSSLQRIMQESRTFDASLRKYDRIVQRVLSPSIMGRTVGRLRQAVFDGSNASDLHSVYDVMMSSLGYMNVELDGLCHLHHRDGVGIRELVRERYEQVLAIGEVYDDLEEGIRSRSQECGEVEALLKEKPSFREGVEARMKLRALRMDLYEKKKKYEGLHTQMEGLERSAEVLEGAHHSHTDVFVTYMMATDAGRNMQKELRVLGPTHITSVYLTAGLGLFEKHVGAITSYNERLKSCVRSRWSSWNGAPRMHQGSEARVLPRLSLLEVARE